MKTLSVAFAPFAIAAAIVGCSANTEDSDADTTDQAQAEEGLSTCTRPTFPAGRCQVWRRDELLSVGCSWSTGRGWRLYSRTSACTYVPGSICENGRSRAPTPAEARNPPPDCR